MDAVERDGDGSSLAFSFLCVSAKLTRAALTTLPQNTVTYAWSCVSCGQSDWLFVPETF